MPTETLVQRQGAPADLALLDQVSRLRRELEDSHLALAAANEHADALQEHLFASAATLQAEVQQRKAAQCRLEELIQAIRQENGDLLALVDILTEQGDAAAESEASARQDALTGIPNRRALEEYLTREWNRCASRGKPFSVAMADVDYFKRYNDVFGHQTGDECLQFVARAIANCCPQGALAARYGGEEFTMVLPGMTVKQARQVGEAMRLAVEASSQSQAVSDKLRRVTISVGVACASPRPGDAGWAGLVDEADQWLLRAKKEGRNRVESPDEARMDKRPETRMEQL